MKKLFILLLVIGISSSIFAQNEKKKTNKVETKDSFDDISIIPPIIIRPPAGS